MLFYFQRSGPSELLPTGNLSSSKSMQASKSFRGLNLLAESPSSSPSPHAAKVFDKKPITKSSSLMEVNTHFLKTKLQSFLIDGGIFISLLVLDAKAKRERFGDAAATVSAPRGAEEDEG